MAYELFVNGAINTTLASGITNVATSLTVASATGFPTSGNFRIVVESEIMLVTAVSGTTFTVTRGVEGTNPAAHSGGTIVKVSLTGGSINQWRSDNFQTGPYSSLPSGREGDLYRPTDAPYIMRYDATNGWECFGPVWKRNPPKLSNFTKTVYGTDPGAVDTNGHVYGKLLGNNALNAVCYSVPVPGSTPWDCTIGFSFHAEFTPDDLSGPSGRELFHLGVCEFDSTNKVIRTWGVGYYNVTGQTSFMRQTLNMNTGVYVNYNRYGSNPGINRCDGAPPLWYIQIHRDAGGIVRNRWSRDGYNFYADDSTDLYSDSEITAPDSLAFFAINNHPSSALHFKFHHWELTS